MYRKLSQITQSLRETQEKLASLIENPPHVAILAKKEQYIQELRKDLARRENLNALLSDEIREQQVTIKQLEAKNHELETAVTKPQEDRCTSLRLIMEDEIREHLRNIAQLEKDVTKLQRKLQEAREERYRK